MTSKKKLLENKYKFDKNLSELISLVQQNRNPSDPKENLSELELNISDVIKVLYTLYRWEDLSEVPDSTMNTFMDVVYGTGDNSAAYVFTNWSYGILHRGDTAFATRWFVMTKNIVKRDESLKHVLLSDIDSGFIPKICVIRSKRINPSLLEWAYDNVDIIVKSSARFINHTTHDYHKKQFLKYIIKNRKCISDSHLDRILYEQPADMLRHLTLYKSTRTEDLVKMMKHSDWKVRRYAALSKYATDEVLQIARDDKHYKVRKIGVNQLVGL